MFQITDEQSRSMDALVPAGFAISTFYGDGVVRMASREADVAVFVRPDGSVKRQTVPVFDREGKMVTA